MRFIFLAQHTDCPAVYRNRFAYPNSRQAREAKRPVAFLLNVRRVGTRPKNKCESPAHLLLEDAHLLPSENLTGRGDLAFFFRQGAPLGLVSCVPEDVRLFVQT